MLIASCARVVASSPHVRIDDTAVARFAARAPDDLLARPSWDDPGLYRGPHVVAWLLAYNAVNFCYWPERGPRWSTVVRGQEVGRDDEALGIMAAFGAALDDGVPLDDGDWLARVDADAVARLLPPAPGAGALPRLEWRARGLRELGRAYATHGGPDGLLARASGSAPALVDVLVTACPSWEDVRTWQGEVLRFRKRAQLCVAMIHGACGGRGPGDLSGLDRLTAFADYRLPQILRGEGILHLAPALATRIAEGREIPPGSPEEIGLRAATVDAAERLRVALEARRPGIDALVVDHLLWRTAVARQHDLPPFHRTPTTDY